SIWGSRSVPSGLVGSGRVPGMIGGFVVGVPRRTGAPDGVMVAKVVDVVPPAPAPGRAASFPFVHAARTSAPAPAANPCSTKRRVSGLPMVSSRFPTRWSIQLLDGVATVAGATSRPARRSAQTEGPRQPGHRLGERGHVRRQLLLVGRGQRFVSL